MGIRIRLLLPWVASVVSVTTLLAADADLRLVEAARRNDTQSIQSLLKQRINVNQTQPEGATALMWAAHHDNAETADLLINAGADVNAANDYGVAPLSIACGNGSSAMVGLLLKAKANPNAAKQTGETPLMTCARRGNLDAVRLLLARGANVNASENRHGQTALMWAAAKNHHQVVRVLVEHGADVQAKTKRVKPWQLATYLGGAQDVVQGDYTPVFFAVQQNALDAVEVLVGAGATLNEAAADGMTPLLMAAASGHEQLALLLVDRGSDPNAADQNGVTALHYAIQRGLAIVGGVRRRVGPNMRELVKALLAHGADPNARFMQLPLRARMIGQPRSGPEGATPFHLAAASNDIPLMRMLLAAGANPNLRTSDNTTALMLATGIAAEARGRRSKEQEQNVLESVQLLVELGNDVNAASTNEERLINGKTAMHVATHLGMDSVIQFLAEQGANVGAADKCGETPLNVALGDPAQVGTVWERLPEGGHKSTAQLLRKLGGDVPLPAPDVPCTTLGQIHYRYSSPLNKVVEAAKPGARE